MVAAVKMREGAAKAAPTPASKTEADATKSAPPAVATPAEPAAVPART